MQGAPWRLTGKPRMSCVRQFCPLFTRIVYTAVQPLSNCGRKFSETPGFFRIQILPDSISAGAPPRSPLGSLQCSPRPHSRLGRGTLPYPIPTHLRRLTVPHHFLKPSAALATVDRHFSDTERRAVPRRRRRLVFWQITREKAEFLV